VRGRCLAGVRPLVDRHQTHEPHQPLSPLAIDRMSLRCQPRRHAARPVERPSQILAVDQRHDRAIFVADLDRAAVDRRAAHRQQSALPRDGKRGALPIDHRAAAGPTHLPNLLDKKSFSTFNWPICR
jgi:hypothetical protein